MDIGLRRVLPTRPGLATAYSACRPAQPPTGIPVRLPVRTHADRSARIFASGFLRATVAGPPLPSANLLLHLDGSGLHPFHAS